MTGRYLKDSIRHATPNFYLSSFIWVSYCRQIQLSHGIFVVKVVFNQAVTNY